MKRTTNDKECQYTLFIQHMYNEVTIIKGLVSFGMSCLSLGLDLRL